MGFVNSILGAGGALVRQAIKSPNYQTGTAGWIVRKDGSAEFSDMLIRSSDGSGATIELENGHLVVKDAAGVVQAEILPDGSIVTYDTRSGVDYFSRLVAATLELGIVGRSNLQSTVVDLYEHGGGLYETTVVGAHDTGTVSPELHLYSETSPGAGDSRATAPGSEWMIQNLITLDGNKEIPVPGGQAGVRLTSFPSAASNVSPVITFAKPFATPPAMAVTIMSGSGTTARWYGRPINVTTTGFQIFVASGDNPTTSQAWASVPVAWKATPATQ